MKSLRYYIDLVEAFSPYGAPSQLNAASGPVELEQAREFNSADAYAYSAYNPISVNSWDREGSAARRQYDAEVKRMRDRWTHYFSQGLIKPVQRPKGMSRFL
jgi:hypothetical protein